MDSDGNIPDCEPIRTTDATVTITHATVGEQLATISSVGGQMEAHSTITVTSVAPIVQCFVPPVEAVGGVVMPAKNFAIVAPWLVIIGLVGCIGTAIVVAKRRQS